MPIVSFYKIRNGFSSLKGETKIQPEEYILLCCHLYYNQYNSYNQYGT